MSYMLGEVDSKVNISATIFTNNTATYHGGAVSVVTGSLLRIFRGIPPSILTPGRRRPVALDYCKVVL